VRRLAVLLLVVAAAVAGCGSGKTDLFATGDAPLDVQLGPQRRVDGGVVVRQVLFRSGSDRIAGYLVVPPGAKEPAPAVLYLHGAGGDRTEQLPYAERLAREGAFGLTITVPSPAKTPPAGATPEEVLRWQRDAIVGDVVAARRGLDLLVEDDRVDPDRLGLVGWSMGGRLATIVAGVDRRLRATVLMSTGAVPVQEYVDAAPEELRDDVADVLPPIDPLAYVGRIGGALLVQDGRSDSVVPARALQAVADGAPHGAAIRWYATDHALDERATQERLAWLESELGLR
jgi:dienelactone hydrolase